jgi:hypothetical protein
MQGVRSSTRSGAGRSGRRGLAVGSMDEGSLDQRDIAIGRKSARRVGRNLHRSGWCSRSRRRGNCRIRIDQAGSALYSGAGS